MYTSVWIWTVSYQNKMCDLLKGRASRSGVYKVLKRLKATDSALSNVRSTPNRKVRTPKLIKKHQRKDQKKSSKKRAKIGLLFLVWATERCRLYLRIIWTCPPTRLPGLSYCLKPQRPRYCKEQSFFWRIWGMVRNLRSYGQMRRYSLSRQFTILKMTGFMQWIRVTSPWMTGWSFGDRNLLLLWSGPG